MADVAYAPKAGREDPDHFGAVFVNDFKSINVREALETGNGYIVTSDPDEQRALDMVDSLKHVTLDEARGEMPAEPQRAPSLTTSTAARRTSCSRSTRRRTCRGRAA
jgi:hypothetical protein